MRATSVGWLKLRSTNPRDHPVIHPNYLSTGNTQATFVSPGPARELGTVHKVPVCPLILTLDPIA